MELLNHTPFLADSIETLDAQGRAVHLVVAKGSWLFQGLGLASPAQAAPLRRLAQRLRLGDLVREPLQQQVIEAAHKAEDWVDWVGADYVLPKPALDVLVAGHCHAPGGRACRQFVAGLSIGDQQWTIEAHAPRRWCPASLLGWHIEPLGEVRTVPMHAAFSLGGQLNPERGPQTALPPKASPALQNRLRLLPWLEDPSAPIRTPRDRPPPAGWNQWPSDAPHRQSHAGHVDEVWRRSRAPRPPLDFNQRFHNLAAPELQLAQVPAPGTRIRLQNLSSRGRDEFAWPDVGLCLQALWHNGHRPPPVHLLPDTLLLEPTQSRFSLTWRAVLPQGEGAGGVRLMELAITRASTSSILKRAAR